MRKNDIIFQERSTSMLGAYKSYWTNYFNFKSRTSRKNYWLVVLANFIVSFILSFLLTLIFGNSSDVSSAKTIEELMEVLRNPAGIISLIWTCVNVIPNISIDVRRLHDVNKSGWFIFINLIPFVGSIIFLVLLLSKSADKDNKYTKEA